MIEAIQQGLKEDGYEVSIAKLCRWFGVPRRTFYYQPVKKSAPKLQARLVSPIKQLIEENPSYGYRTVAALLRFNKNTVQRIFQLKGWQVRKRSVGFRPRVEVSPSKAVSLNERWATDLCRVWAGRDGWASLALVIDCHNRELIGWHLSRNGRAQMASSALEQAPVCQHRPELLDFEITYKLGQSGAHYAKTSDTDRIQSGAEPFLRKTHPSRVYARV